MNTRQILKNARIVGLNLFALIITFNGLSQYVQFENFSTKNGLPCNEVYHMYQDVNGYMWFATDHCISRYDGYSFENFGLKDGLTSNTVFRFYPQKNGVVWCSTLNNEFFYFDPADYDFKSYQFNDQISKAARNGINDDLIIEEDGTVHVGFIDRSGVLSVDPKGNVISNGFGSNKSNAKVSIALEIHPNGEELGYIEYSKPKQYFKGSIGSRITSEIESSSYHKTAAQGDIHLLSDATNLYVFRLGKLIKRIPSGRKIFGLGFTGKNRFWIGYEYGGVTLYDLKGNEIKSFLEGESVGCFLMDHEGGAWISTLTSGVYYASSLSVKQFSFDPTPYVYSLSRNREGTLLAGLYDGSMFQMEDGGFGFLQNSHQKIPSFLQYYSSMDAELSIFDETTIDEIPISGRSLTGLRKVSDEIDEMPILISRAQIFVFSGDSVSEHLNTRDIRDACHAKKGIYLATTEGLFHYNLKNRTSKRVQNRHLQYRIYDIDKWKEGCFIGGSYGNGVVILEKDKVWSINEEDGLTSDIVHEIHVQNDSTIWACTNVGLNRIKLFGNQRYEISAFTSSDGLTDNAVTDVEIIGSNVWVATRSGVSSFPIWLMDDESESPTYFLRALKTKVNGHRMDDIEDLSHWQNKLEFKFQGISFKGKDKLRYRYKMIGLHDQWNYTSNRSVIYEALSPGSYTFTLQVGMNNRWSDEIIEVPFEISPAYYMTTWFRLLILGLIGALVYLFFKLRVLVYNRDLTRELLRLLLKRMKRKSDYFVVRENGQEVRISSGDVQYIKSLGNYLEIYTTKGKVVIRERISKVMDLVPDPIEYIQVRRSYIVRIDKIDKKGANSIFISEHEIKIGKTYLEVLSKISF